MSFSRVVVVQQTRGPSLRGVFEPTLARFGYEAESVRDSEFELGDDDALVWLYGTFNWYPRTVRSLLARPPGRRPRVVLWHSEPLPLPKAAGISLARLHAREIAKILLRDSRRQDPASNFRALRRLLPKGLPGVLVASTREKQEFLGEHGIEAAFVPLGYQEELHGKDLGLERDIDVLFLGVREVPRRKSILRGLRAQGVSVLEVGGYGDPAFWGDNRTQLLNRTKILLNIPRHPGILAGYRMILGMANKALVVAEPIYRPDPYEPGVHYVSAPPGGMPEVIAGLLEDEDARRRLTDRAYDFVRTSVTQERSVGEILALARDVG